MARSLNRVQLIGRLGQDCETRYTQSGVAVGNYSIATDRRFKKGDDWVEETDWHQVVHWRCENVAPYLTKGTQVYVEGHLQTRKWEDQSGQTRYQTEVVVSNLILLGGNKGESGEGSSAPPRQRSQGRPQSRREPAQSDFGVGDDDVPF